MPTVGRGRLESIRAESLIVFDGGEITSATTPPIIINLDA
jgi:hypothetical protein